MDAHRVGLVTILALGAVAVAGSITAGLAGVAVHGSGTLVWDLGVVLPLLLISAYAWLTRPSHPTTQRMAVMASLFALQSVFAPPVSFTPGGVTIPSDVVTLGRQQLWISFFGFQVLNVGMMMTLAWLLALYPDGQLETRTERRLLRPLWLAMALPFVVLVAYPTLLPPSYEGSPGTEPSPFFISPLEPIGTVAVTLLRAAEAVLPLLGIGLLIARYRRSGVATRQRIRWLLLPVAVGLAMAILERFVPAGFGDTAVVVVAPAFGIALLLGVREQRIVPIDIVLRRSLVYGLLWLLIIGAYVGIAAGLGLAVSERFPVVVAILLTIGVTLAFRPARRWLEGLADRLVFGARLGRYEALTRLGRLLEETFDLEELLPHLARTVRMTLGLAWARIELADEPGGTARTAAVDGEPADDEPAMTVPVELAGEHLGLFACGPKVRGTLGEPDQAVLEDLARQAALAIRNVRLAAQLADRVEQLRHRTDELAESRRRLVRTQEAERRRIERDLHDGIQQDLVALIGEVGRARAHLDGTAPQTVPVLGELQDELARVLQDLRELAHGIHPQLLTDRGLLAAVEVRARRCPVPVTVRAAGALRETRFPGEVEGAAYFTVCEALANMLKHAQATQGEVWLDHRVGRLIVDVSDDGIGLRDAAPELVEGHGLGNLAERLAALDGTLNITPHDGGGTLLHAELPTARGLEPSRE